MNTGKQTTHDAFSVALRDPKVLLADLFHMRNSAIRQMRHKIINSRILVAEIMGMQKKWEEKRKRRFGLVDVSIVKEL